MSVDHQQDHLHGTRLAGESGTEPGFDHSPGLGAAVDGQDERANDILVFSKRDRESVAREEAYLIELEGRPLHRRVGGYLKLSGPGWVQGALTLGGGSGSTSLFAGALAGYAMLWVQPLSMALGVIMMAALAHQTLSTGIRPFHAVNRFAHPILGWGWAMATLIANFIWCFGQFNVTASVIGDMCTAGHETFPTFAVTAGRALTGAEATPAQAAASFFGLAAMPFIALAAYRVTLHYNRGSSGVRWFENLLKIMVAGIILCFAVVALKTDINWSGAAKSFFAFRVPRETDQFDVMISAFATAVGINMTFLLPYLLLARGWGRAHRGLVKYDLGFGLLVPFVLATGFIVLASGNVLHPKLNERIAEIRADASLTAEEQAAQIQAAKDVGRSATYMAQSLEPLLGKRMSHYVFGLGFLAMTTSSIITMMLISGFAFNEMWGGPFGGRAHKFGMFLPVLAASSPLVFGHLQMWLMVPVSVFCFFFMPIAYITFFAMMNNKAFMGADRPEGWRRWSWNAGMLVAITVVTVGGAYRIFMIVAG